MWNNRHLILLFLCPMGLQAIYLFPDNCPLENHKIKCLSLDWLCAICITVQCKKSCWQVKKPASSALILHVHFQVSDCLSKSWTYCKLNLNVMFFFQENYVHMCVSSMCRILRIKILSPLCTTEQIFLNVMASIQISWVDGQ